MSDNASMNGENNTPAIETTEENLNRLHTMFSMLDPNREGLGLNMVRNIFPREGWNVVLAHVNRLVEDGRLEKTPVMGRGGVVLYETYRVKGGE